MKKGDGKLNITTIGEFDRIAERYVYDTGAVGSNGTHSHFGHDKSLAIKPYAALPPNERPILLYAGDGVSDLSAASETDLLFAKKGHGMCSTPPELSQIFFCH